MESRTLLLRILYTINSSPQYILARSVSHVQVTPLQSLQNNDRSRATDPATRPEFGTVSLKTCLDIICRSSPELVQDSRRDFSVYFLDPLESNSAPAPVNISNQPSGSQISNDSYEHPRGVAVGLGVMSLALLANNKDNTVVTGTLIKLNTGQEALQVIFALQEMVTLQKFPMHGTLPSCGQPSETTSNSQVDTFSFSDRSMSNSSGASFSTLTPSPSYLAQTPYGADVTTLATIASIQKRSQERRVKAKLKKPVKPSPLNPMNSEADRLMLSGDIYVGPTKKKGRPANAAASSSECKNSTGKSQTKLESTVPLAARSDERSMPPNEVCGGPYSHFKSAFSNTHRSQIGGQPPSQDSTDEAIAPTQSAEDQEASLGVLASISALCSSGDLDAKNAALLTVLNAIDSSSLARSLGERPQNPALADALRHLLSAVSQRPQPVLDSYDPKHSSSTHRRGRSPDHEVILLDKENVNPMAFQRRNDKDTKILNSESSSQPAANVSTPKRSLSIRSNGSVNTVSVAPTPTTPMTNESGSRRKRTLSDFMDERETGKSKLADRRNTYRSIYSSPSRRSSSSAHRHYPRLVSDDSQAHRKGTNSYYRTGMVFWTSPPRSINENVKTHHGRGNSREQIITILDSPEPPRATASSPVRSASTQPQVRRKYVVPAWARTETSTQPRLSEEAQRALELAEARKRQEKEARKKGRKGTEKEQRKRQVRSPSPFQRASRNVRQKPTHNTTQAIKRPPPVTVASDCPVFAITSAIEDRVAAFRSSDPPQPSSPQFSDRCNPLPPCTPPRARRTDLFTPGASGSLFTPLLLEQGSNLPGSTRSPLERDQCKGSIVSSVGGNSLRPTRVALEDTNNIPAGTIEEDSEEALNQELSIAFEDLGAPSCPLSAASSECAIPAESRLHVADDTSLARDSEIEFPKKQHWEGLPPSSPLPPTSPISTPFDEESDALSDDMELPAANSDPEPYPADSELSQDSAADPSALSDGDYIDGSDIPPLFTFSDNHTTFEDDPQASVVNTLSRLTDNIAHFDNLNPTTDADVSLFGNELLNFDSTEFWETLDSLLHNQSDEAARSFGSGFLQSPKTLDVVNPDHTKLAEDIQALFSGCLM